jgi:predicted small secreted protein
MMKPVAFLILLSALSASLSGCGNSKTPAGHDRQLDDYVLIEFAAKLEEDYHRLKSADSNSSASEPTEALPVQTPTNHP